VHPLTTGHTAAGANSRGEMGINSARHEKLGLFGPAIAALGQTDFLLAQGLAMGLWCVLLVRRAVTDMTVQHDESGPAFGLAENLERPFDAIHIVSIADAQDVPTVGQKTSRNILREGDVGVAFDGDVVVVEDPAKIVRPK